MKKHKRSFAQDMRRAFNALAYAHLGEMVSETTKRDLVGDESPDRTERLKPVGRGASIPVVRRKRVALVVDGRIRPGALRYALNACTRLDADLEVLTNLPEAKIEEAIAREDLVPGFVCQVFQLGTDLLSGITKHVRSHTNTIFIVTSATDALADKFVTDYPDGLDTHVPWLVVSDNLCAA